MGLAWFDSSKGYGERWIGNGKKLVEWYKNELNSTAKYKYPSKVLERVRSAIKQLNENPEVPFFLQLKEENGNYKFEIHRKELCTLKREIPFDKIPNFLRKAVIKLIERKKLIREPYALARSMSWKELEELIKKIVVVAVQKDTWEFIESISQKFQNEAEKKELQQTVLSVEKLENQALIALEKSRVKKTNPLYRLLESLEPGWKEFLSSGLGYLKEVKIVNS